MLQYCLDPQILEARLYEYSSSATQHNSSVHPLLHIGTPRKATLKPRGKASSRNTQFQSTLKQAVNTSMRAQKFVKILGILLQMYACPTCIFRNFFPNGSYRNLGAYKYSILMGFSFGYRAGNLRLCFSTIPR